MTDVTQLVAWLAAAGDGDSVALRKVYDATSAKLYGIILRILIDRHDAEEVLQEVYVTVWRKAAEFDAARASPITWLATIARNRAIDRFRARGNRATTTLDAVAEIADEAPAADVMLAASQDAIRVQRALDSLEPRHAAVIRRAYFEGLTYEALAAREGVPVGTLKSWVRRGVIRTRASLAP